MAYLVPAVECNPPGFYLEVTLYDGGASDAAEPLFTADVVWTINGVSNPAYIVSGSWDLRSHWSVHSHWAAS
ncbi:MAG: hypothetical protein IPO87_11925 [Flavobacteriales bacterium]|nr:hypothetical protein [Flavobacteriales bacterium]